MFSYGLVKMGLGLSIIGLKLIYNSTCIFISQESYAREILRKFKMKNCNPISTPAKHGIKMCKHEEEDNVDPTFLKTLIWLKVYAA